MSSTPPIPKVERFSRAAVPTEYGVFDVHVYREEGSPLEHVALVMGDVSGGEDILMRVHSECLTGEVFHSLKCDCREQLDLAFRRIADRGQGLVIYLRQEGRGIGLGNKIRAYALQAQGLDTVDANRAIGFEDDLRRYHAATAILADLGVHSVALMTNNPAKVGALEKDGVRITRRFEHLVEPHELNRDYLDTKRERMGHLYDLEDGPELPELLAVHDAE